MNCTTRILKTILNVGVSKYMYYPNILNFASNRILKFKVWIWLVMQTVKSSYKIICTNSYKADNFNKKCENWTFFLTQHKPHLGLPRTWIISPKAMLKDPPSWDFRGRATTCHECTVFVKECFVLMAFPLKDINSIAINVKPPTSSKS